MSMPEFEPPKPRRVVIVLVVIGLAAVGRWTYVQFEKREQVAQAQAQEAKAQAIEDERKRYFAANKTGLIANVAALVDAKRWDDARAEARKWSDMNAPELAELYARADRLQEIAIHAERSASVAAALKQAEVDRVAARAAEKADRAARRKQGIRIGMTADEVLMSNWGKPERINRTVHRRTVSEQWVYGGSNYVYLENGVVTSIQTSR
jgi:hypothetical protein